MRSLFTQRILRNVVRNQMGKAYTHDRVQCGMKVSKIGSFSTSTDAADLVLTKIDEETGVATLSMNRPPVNSLSLEMLQAISASIKKVESNENVQGLVLASTLSSIFSAGLDIAELHKPDPKRLKEFWESFQQVYLDLYGSRLACIAAIEGHAPAAGTMLALSCDFRIMTSTKATIGLNETKLGIVAPPWLGQQLISTIGQREAEMALSLGLLYSPDDALHIGLVDSVTLKSQVKARAHEEAVKWGRIPPLARFASKMLVRQQYLDQLVKTRQQDTDHFCTFVQQDLVQRSIEGYLESLKKKSKK